MGIRFACSNCRKILNIKTELAGKTGTCPKCKTKLTVPAESQISDQQLKEMKARARQAAGAAAPATEASGSAAQSDVQAQPAPVNDRVIGQGSGTALSIGGNSPATGSVQPSPVQPAAVQPVSTATVQPASPAQAQPEVPAVTPVETIESIPKVLVDANPAQPGAVPQNVAPQNVAPQNVAPQNVAPQNVAPQNVAPQNVAPQNVAPQNVAPQNVASQNVAPQNAGQQPVVDAAASVPANSATTGPALPMAVPLGQNQAPAAMPDPITANPDAIWYVRPPTGGQFGPASGDLMRKWMREDRVGAKAYVWQEGWPDWKNATEVFPEYAQSAAGAANISNQQVASNAEQIPSSLATRTRIQRKKRRQTAFWITMMVMGSIMLIGLIILMIIVLQNL